MSGDYSRVRFDPKNDFSAVLMQQGRVQLDSDWNEFASLLDRRWRTETVDIIGKGTVPKETPDGFRIQIPGGALTIGRGRIYVDGLLAENHGKAPLEFDPVLAERRGTLPVPYNEQPYFPNVSVVAPAPTSGGPHLVYLDVWQREVTFLEDRNLTEKAVGVDTTTRSQTVWQVKILPNVGSGATCGSQLEAWNNLIAPSDGRLSSAAVGVPTNTDPCLLPPSGGYRGLENRLYRVEIHDGGPSGTATFKWSRDNASMATSVTAITVLNKLTVASLGRDSVTHFNSGDWIEVTDDWLDFARQSGVSPQAAGVMAKVQSVDEDNRTITLVSPILANVFTTDAQGNTDPARHTRVRRWDQSGQVRDTNGNLLIDLTASSEGVIPVPAGGTSIVLEDGVQITFDTPAAGKYKIGNYWDFAARTADASVEELKQAPPLGVHHHFCRLALVTFPDSVTDCRTLWEIAPGCCTVVVGPGESVQAALDSLPAEGGCVCLKPGQHEIDRPLRIEKSNVTLHGETLGARVVRNNGATLLEVGQVRGAFLENIKVTDVEFVFDNKRVQPTGLSHLVRIERCNRGKFDGCVVRTAELGNVVGILISDSSDLQVSDCRVDGVRYGVWVVNNSTELAILDNGFDAAAPNDTDGGVAGVFLMDAFGPSRIERNAITGFHYGIVVNKGLLTGAPSSMATGSLMAGNRIVRLDRRSDAGGDKLFGIDVAANDCVIRDNLLTYAAPAYGGIVASGSHATIDNNGLRCLAREAGADPCIGILVGRLGGQGSFGSNGGRVAGNSLAGAQDGIVVIDNTAIEVVENRIESSAAPVRFGILLTNVNRARVRGNRITNALFLIAGTQGVANKIIGNALLRGGGAVTMLTQTSPEVTQNSIEDMRNWGFIGIQLFAKVALTENRFLSCGYQQSPAISIGVSQHLGELHIESCEVMNTGVSPDSATVSTISWGIFADLVLEARVQSNIVTFSNAAAMDANQEHRALWMRGFLEQVINTGAGQFVFGFSAQILDNKFLGPGRSALVETAQQQVTNTLLRRFERLFFNNNFCWHASVAGQPPGATVSLFGRSAIVMGNHIKTNVLLPSVDFHGMRDAIYMGNIAQTNPVNFVGVPTPPPGFNKP